MIVENWNIVVNSEVQGSFINFDNQIDVRHI